MEWWELHWLCHHRIPSNILSTVLCPAFTAVLKSHLSITLKWNNESASFPSNKLLYCFICALNCCWLLCQFPLPGKLGKIFLYKFRRRKLFDDQWSTMYVKWLIKFPCFLHQILQVKNPILWFSTCSKPCCLDSYLWLHFLFDKI